MSRWSWRSERWAVVDYDQRTIRGIAARRRGASWRLEGWAEEALTGSPADSLRGLLARLPGGRERLVVLLPRTLFLERILTVPPISARHLAGLVTEELDATLPWPAAERCDGWATEAVRGTHPGRRRPEPRRLVAISAQRAAIQPFLTACEDLGVSFAGAVPASVGLLNAARSAHGLPPSGRLLLVGGRDEVDLVAVVDGRWEFSRAFGRGETQGEVARSQDLLLPDDVTRVAAETLLWAPPDLALPFPPDVGVQPWRPSLGSDLPPAYWPALGALLAATGEGALPLVVGRAGNVPEENPLRKWLAVGLVAALALAAFGGFGLQRIRGRQALDRAAAAEAAETAERAAWGRVAFPTELRLRQLETLAGALPPGTRLESLRLERDRVAELRAGAPRASAVLSSLAVADGLDEVALAGPAIRRPESEEESFALTARFSAATTVPGSSSAGASRPGSTLAELRSFALAGFGSDQALARLLLLVERASVTAGVRLESKNAQLLAPSSGRERLGLDVSFSGDDRNLTTFLTAIGERNPLLSLEFLTARRIARENASRGGVLYGVQLVLDRPATASTAPVPPAQPSPTSGSTRSRLLRLATYPSLQAGRLFGLTPAVTPALVPADSKATPTSSVPPPAPPKSGLVLLGVVYDPVSPRALVRAVAGGPALVVKPGDVVGREKVLQIGPDGVSVEVDGRPTRLPLPGQERQQSQTD
ncbi:MAG: GspMb/PilO family protein [Methanocella sp.]